MAQCFISDSSRRPQQISEDEMQHNWDRDLPRPEKVVCNQCHRPDYKNKYINGLCTTCARGFIHDSCASDPHIQVH